MKGLMRKKLFSTVLKIKMRVILVAACVASVLGLAMLAPQLHSAFIRNKVGSQVIMLTNKAGNSGGTGFALRAPSGKVVTVTNAHVCNIPGNRLYANLPSGQKIAFNIIKKSKVTDLCALTAVKGMSGLEVASSVIVGENIGVVGFPKLQPLTLTLGELVGYQDTAVLVDEGPCEKDVGMYSTVMTFFGPVCIETVKQAAITTLPVRGGSSGSPVVNFFGNVVGVLFAGDELGWGVVVSMKDLNNFLKGL